MNFRQAPVRFAAPGRFLSATMLRAVLLLGVTAVPVMVSPVNAASAPAADLGDLSLEELLEVRIEKVYSASKYEQRVTRAPASVSIVTADEIKKFGHHTLADVLRGVRGMYVTDDRNYSYLGMRGFARPGDYNSRALLLVDGHRLNDGLYSSALIGPEEVIDLDLVQRVEIIRGPSSSIYGANAFFGVINLITRPPEDYGGWETSLSGGSRAAYKTRLSYGRRFHDDGGLTLSGSVYHTDGEPRLHYPEYDTPETNHGVAENADADDAQQWLARCSWRDLSFTAGYSRRVKHIPTAAYDSVFNDNRLDSVDTTFFADLTYERELNPSWQTMVRFTYDQYRFKGTYPYDYADPGDPPDMVLNYDNDHTDGAGAEVQLTGRLWNRHTLVLGAVYRHDFHIAQQNYDSPPRIDYLDYDLRADSGGLYVQNEFSVHPDLLLSAGLRWDHFSRFGSTLNPRVGAIYNPTPATTFKLLYGTAYRTPNTYETNSSYADYAKANPGLHPEAIQTYELIYEHYLSHGLRFNVSAYRYTIDDLINQVTDPQDGLLIFENSGRVDAHGLEFELEGRYAHGLLARASYAWQRAEDRDTGRPLDNSPEHMAKLNLLLPIITDKVTAGLELQYLSRLETLAGNHSDGFTLANLTLYGRPLGDRFELSATVRNLFDTHYAYPAPVANAQDVIPQNGRSIWLKLTCRF